MKSSVVGRWLPVVVWTALILVGTSISPRALPRGPENSDKIAHLLMYAVLAMLLARALAEVGRGRELTGRQAALLLVKTFIICAVFGALDEWHQQFVQRTTSLADWIADVVGAAAGAFGLVAYLKKRKEGGHGGDAADQR